MKTIYKALFGLLSIFFLFFICGRFFMSFTHGWYKDIVPNRFSSTGWALLFFIVTVAVGSALFFLLRHIRVDISQRKSYIALALILFFKLLLFMVFYVAVEPRSDYKTYHLLASAISQGGIYIPDYIAVFPHVIGYPSVLAIIYRIFGASVDAGVYFNLFLSLLIIILMFIIAKRMGKTNTGLLAALFYTSMPSSTLYTYLLCSEFLFQVIALLIITLFIISSQTKRRSLFLTLTVLNSIFIALLSSIRPNGLVLLVALLIVTLVFTQRFGISPSPKIIKPFLSVTYIALYLLTSLAVNVGIEKMIGAEIADNKLGWNLYVGLNKEALGTWNPEDAELFGVLLDEKGPKGAQSEFYVKALQRLQDIQHPSKFIPFLVGKTLNMWTHDHEVIQYIEVADKRADSWWLANARVLKTLKLFGDSVFIILMIFIIIGFIFKMKKPANSYHSYQIIFVLFLLGTIALHLPFEAASRYHNPVLASLCILAAFAITESRDMNADDAFSQ